MFNQQAKFKLTNPYFFWGLISVLLVLTFFLNQYFTSSLGLIETKITPSIVEQSYTEKKIVIDPDNLHYMNFEDGQSVVKDQESYVANLYEKLIENSTVFLLLFYTIILSALFVYREKQHKNMLVYMEKMEDELQIQIAVIDANVDLYEDLGREIEKHRSILEPELKVEGLKERLSSDAVYVIITARMVTEKIILKLYSKYFDNEATLNDMMMALYRKRILNPSMNNYAHTIKAFGNKAIHPNINSPVIFETKEALFVISSLLQFIKELDSKNLLKD